MLPEKTCYLLTLAFDDANWQAGTRAIVGVCRARRPVRAGALPLRSRRPCLAAFCRGPPLRQGGSARRRTADRRHGRLRWFFLHRPRAPPRDLWTLRSAIAGPRRQGRPAGPDVCRREQFAGGIAGHGGGAGGVFAQYDAKQRMTLAHFQMHNF